MLDAYFLQQGRHIYSSFSSFSHKRPQNRFPPRSPTKLSIINLCRNFIHLVGNPPREDRCFWWIMRFLCLCSGWIRWEVNHLCFTPSRHLLVVDSERWWTAGPANQRRASAPCGGGVQSRGAWAGLASRGREPGGGRSRSDSSASRLWCDTDQRSCDSDPLYRRDMEGPWTATQILTGRQHVEPLWPQLQISAFCGHPAVKLRLKGKGAWKLHGRRLKLRSG